jgi:hypothetical protein
MSFALRIDGVCQKCFKSIYDSAGRCRVCASITRRARKTGITWEEASRFEFKPRTGYAEFTEKELTSKQKYLKTEKGRAYSRR